MIDGGGALESALRLVGLDQGRNLRVDLTQIIATICVIFQVAVKDLGHGRRPG